MQIRGSIIQKEQEFDTKILYPWLDNKTFNKWFVPEGFDLPISMLDISDADKCDFRKGAFQKMLHFLIENGEIKRHQENIIVNFLPFNPIYVVCGPTCAGKSTVGRLLLEKHDYYHIEASDFMSLKYYETHGTKSSVDKNIFAAELLKTSPLVVVEKLVHYIISKKIFNNFIITGFRTSKEVSNFSKMFPSQDLRLIYIDTDSPIRYNRWVNRQRDAVDYTQDRFVQINKLQEGMGLLEIKKMENVILYENNKNGLISFCNDFQNKIIGVNPVSRGENLDSILFIPKISLEKAVLFILAMEYQKNESLYYTTTEISHLINNTFKGVTKNKNNISRYFNQAYYPVIETEIFIIT